MPSVGCTRMDKIFIRGLSVETIIGIYDWERTTPQTVVVDLEMATDIRKAASTEDIDETLNYKEISKRVEQFLINSQYQLIETLAEDLCEVVMSEFGVKWLHLVVHKPGALSNSTDVGLEITRTADE